MYYYKSIIALLMVLLATSVCIADPFENNNDLSTAANVGVIPGVHLTDIDINTSADQDWYKVELLRNDTVDMAILFTRSLGNLQFKVTNKQGTEIAQSSPSGDSEILHLPDLASGTYYICVYGVAGATNTYTLQAEPGTGSTTRVFYVNDTNLVSNVYTLASGNNSNDALTPQTPKATIQNVLDSYDLGPLDIVLIDTGTYGQGFAVVASDEGIICAGSPYGTILNPSGTVINLTDADHNLFYSLTLYGSTGIYSHNSGVNPSSDNIYRANIFYSTAYAIQLYQSQNEQIQENIMTGAGSYGVQVSYGTANIIENNAIDQKTNGVYVGQSESQCRILNNRIFNSSTGIYIHNTSSNSELSGNEVYQNVTGVDSRISSASVCGNLIHNNTTGINGYGIIGPADWSANGENLIYDNTTGITARNGSTIQHNRIYSNSVGISVPEDNITIHHNLIYRNTGQGILLSDGDTVQLTNNTLYALSGDLIKIQSNSSSVTLKNNIIWAESGYDLYVALDSQVGFASDYNNFFASGSGKLIWWCKDFVDIFDWQVETDYDSHSIGYTAPHPNLDNPCFADLTHDDYHLQNQVSTSIDRGDPASTFNMESAPDGNRINLGAYGGTNQAALSKSAYIVIEYPNFYTDMEANKGQVVVWRTYDESQPDKKISGLLDIDLYEQGVGKVADITQIDASEESVSWTPSVLGIAGSVSKRYTIHIESVASPAINTDSREPFSLVSESQYYYVDDNSNSNDEYTPGAIGSNRNTGHTAEDPKAGLVSVIRAFDLGPGDVVFVDTGDYFQFRNIVLSGDLLLGDDEGMTLTGPTDPDRKAVLNRANKNTGTRVIEINKGDYIALQNLSLTGAEQGLYAHTCSYLICENLTVYNNNSYGIRFDSDTVQASIQYCDVYQNGSYGIYVTGNSSYPATLVQYNKVHDNLSNGIYASGNVAVNKNTVYGQITTNN